MFGSSGRFALPWRRRQMTQPMLLVGLIVMTGAFAAAYAVLPQWVPLSSAVMLILLGGFLLRLRPLLVLLATVGITTALAVLQRGSPRPVPGVYGVLAATAVLVLVFARGRQRLGVQGLLGESMLVDLRDRLRAQGAEPPLPQGWCLETVLRSAYGDSFSGDFLVATRSDDGAWLELALVDVSGKGQQAGTRALLLSGAFGGLLGALPRESFFPAANRYLLRQDWEEGFATGIHLAVELATGAYRLSGAGHPPAAHYHAGSGRWELLEAEQGPLLGVVADAAFPQLTGRLDRGDAVLLYTDGLVETPGRDLSLGIDRLIGQAERQITRGFAGSAERIVDGTRTGEGDDRALVLLWRQ